MTRDLRKYARKTNRRLFIGFGLILVLVGDGLIYWMYGQNAAILGLICILAGIGPVALIWLVLNGFEWIVKRANENE